MPVHLLAVVPVLFLTLFIVKEWREGQVAPDFHWGLYRQAKDLLKSGVGFDPSGAAVDGQNRVYTVFSALLAAPFTLLPVGVADLLVTALLIVAAGATAYVINVRDWRAYAVLFLWPPVLSGIQTGNLTLLLGLLAAVAWRYRDRRFVPGLLVGVAVAAKVFMWPLMVWLVASRRFGAALAAAATAVVSVVLMVPFGSPLGYFELARRVADRFDKSAYSLYTLLGANGAARLAWFATAALVLLAAFVVGDRLSFTLAIAGCILFSPIVWIHYFALLLVPLAIARPRFAVLWLAPLAFWLLPFAPVERWQIAFALGSMFCILYAIVRRGPGAGQVLRIDRGSSPSLAGTR
jgi:hypothetical protein